MLRIVALLLVFFIGTSTARAETVFVKYRGIVDVTSFDCRSVSRSSLVKRVCYDPAQQYMIVNLNGTYYHYCELPPATFTALMAAPSMGQFYNRNIKGWRSDGPYDCRTHRMPAYSR